MTQDRRAVLELLSKGRITVDEAERLLAALGVPSGDRPVEKAKARYLRVVVDADEEGDGPTKLNIRIPLALLRAGVRLSSLIPSEARSSVEAALRENGVPADLANLKGEDLVQLVDQLGDLSVEVDQARAKVQVFCE